MMDEQEQRTWVWRLVVVTILIAVMFLIAIK
jgi:hypothetical protein